MFEIFGIQSLENLASGILKSMQRVYMRKEQLTTLWKVNEG